MDVCKIKGGASGAGLPGELRAAAGLTRRGQQRRFGGRRQHSFAPSVALTSPQPSALHLGAHPADTPGSFKLKIRRN